jgi:hypothetical protein
MHGLSEAYNPQCPHTTTHLACFCGISRLHEHVTGSKRVKKKMEKKGKWGGHILLTRGVSHCGLAIFTLKSILMQTNN